ncbi:MAG: glycosyltransferase [Nodosilinea sp.]
MTQLALPALAHPCRVSILASDLSAQGAGRWGGAVRPFLLGQALQRMGYTVDMVGFTPDVDGPSWPCDIPIQAIPVASPRLGRAAIAELFRHLRGDIIYAYKLKPSSFGLALLHRLRHHRPVVLDIDDWELSWHGGEGWRYRASPHQIARQLLKPDGALRHPDHPLYLQWIERLVPQADLVTTHTGFLQQRFGGVYIPNGKDTDLFNPSNYAAEACRADYGLTPYRVLMFPGAPRSYKGVEDLLVAMDVLDQPDLKLVLVGGSPYDNYDQELLTRWPQRIIHLGKRPYAEMPRVIAAAHVVVVPQRQTPAAQAQFPLKLTDAMAMAKPILATRVGDIPTILNGTGYLAEASAPDQLAQQITAIFDDYDRALHLGHLARTRCVSHYSIDAMGQLLHQSLIQLLPPRP